MYKKYVNIQKYKKGNLHRKFQITLSNDYLKKLNDFEPTQDEEKGKKFFTTNTNPHVTNLEKEKESQKVHKKRQRRKVEYKSILKDTNAKKKV